MPTRYRRTVTIGVTPEQAWPAFVDPTHLAAWHGHAERFEAVPGGRIRFVNPGWEDVDGIVDEVVPARLLLWRTTDGQAEIAETLVPAKGGTQVTLEETGPGLLAPEEIDAIRLGWDESIADLALYLETGVSVRRHMAPRSRLGAATRDTTAGVRVVRVEAGSLAESFGLAPDDLIVRIGRAPIFDRSDVALLLREHESGTELEITVVRGRELRSSRARI
jgi:uncharacterized protein YndB with AHSA1/START domain